MIHILKLGKTINFVEFDYKDLDNQLITNEVSCNTVDSNDAHDNWMWEHRYMFLTFHSFASVNDAMNFINNSVSIQDEIREENLKIIIPKQI